MTHLLLLWCLGVDLTIECTQERAYRIEDAGPAPEGDQCLKATERWIDRDGTASLHNLETLRFACEVLR